MYNDAGRAEMAYPVSERLLSSRTVQKGLSFRLLPFQILLIVISAVNGIVDSLNASNAIEKEAMSANGLYRPMKHFLYAASIILLNGSQGRYLEKDRNHIQSVFSVTLLASSLLSLLIIMLLVLSASLDLTCFCIRRDGSSGAQCVYLRIECGNPCLIDRPAVVCILPLEDQTKRSMAASIACFIECQGISGSESAGFERTDDAHITCMAATSVLRYDPGRRMTCEGLCRNTQTKQPADWISGLFSILKMMEKRSLIV